MISEQATPRPVDGYRIEEMDGELLLYHPQSTATVYMNRTAALVWQLCDGERRVVDILELLRDSFPEAGDTIGRDVMQALDSFREQGALRV